MFGAGPFAGAPFGAPLSAGSGGAAFSISPSVGHATGTIAITATGFGTSWTGSNPFSVTGGSGSATISNYANVSGTSATSSRASSAVTTSTCTSWTPARSSWTSP